MYKNFPLKTAEFKYKLQNPVLMVKKAYVVLKEKYSLPDYDVVNNELEISSIDSDDFLLSKIRKRIVERIESLVMNLSSILQPSADSLSDMHECRFFDDSEKKKIVGLYKQMMIFNRLSLEADLMRNEKKDAEFIKSFFKAWPDMKKEIFPFLEKMKSCWEKDIHIDEKLEYFG